MLKEQIKNDFQQYLNQVNGEKGSEFVKMREEAMSEFEALGFPTKKNEEWKYTSLRNIAEKNFQSSCVNSADATELMNKSLLKDLKSNRLVFVNGSYYPDLSDIIEEDQTILITTIAKARKNHTDLFNKHFGKYAKFKGESFNAMNTALMSDGAFVYIPEGKSVKHPVLIMHITDSTGANVLSQPRNLLVVDKSASLQVIENYISTGDQASFTNVVNEIFLDDYAKLEHYKVQRESGESYHNNYTQVFQNAHTNSNQVTLTLDGALVRNNLHFYLNGKDSNSLLYGLYITDEKKHVDNHTRVDHAQPNCNSDEKYKGILKDQSTAVFNGKIMVHLDAQKTNAYQRNQNMLLSGDATINTKPQLEIFADDVKCTHGATVGQLDEEPLFYMRSRGIPEAEARRMLLNAFADEIAEMIRIPELVQILEEEIEKKL